MRYGKERYFDNHVDYLMEMMQYTGGVFNDDKIPSNAARFVREQYARFGIEVPKHLDFLYDFGSGIILEALNRYDPYLLYWGYSDVEYNNDWEKYTYEVEYNNDWEKYTYEVDSETAHCELDPEALETFSYIPGRAEGFFNEYIVKPGFQALPSPLVASLDDIAWQALDDDAIITALQDFDYPPQKEMWFKVCRHAGVGVEFSQESKAWPYFDLSLWAAALWWFGPLSREQRMISSTLQEVAITCGECIVYNGDVHSPGQYRKIPRPPMSCYKCGRDAWCVEDTVDGDGNFRKICEACLSKDFPRFGGATCGTKFCRYFECPANSWHLDENARMAGMRQHGQLGKQAQKSREQIAASAEPQKKLRA